MKAKTIGNREVELKAELVNGLKTRLRGPVLLPGEAGYDESRTVWNAMIDRKPALVARCLGVADVVTCVQFAREHELLLCIKGGGHNIAGLGKGLQRLAKVKGQWDPQNFFRSNRNITPVSTGLNTGAT